jgi:hypothetical protein
VPSLSSHCLLSALTLLALLGPGTESRAQDVLWVHAGPSHPEDQNQLRQLVDFEGLRLVSVNARDPGGVLGQLRQLGPVPILAIIASAESLSLIDRRLQDRVRSIEGVAPPLLIYGIDATTAGRQLQMWSENTILDCEALQVTNARGLLRVATDAPHAGALSGLDLPAVAAPDCRLSLGSAVPHPTRSGSSSSSLLTQISGDGSNPVLVATRTSTGEVFFLPRLKLLDRSWIGKPSSLPEAFSSLAPMLLFLGYAAGSYSWHLDGHYANFTIDDPWLTEPYGNLNYHGLLAEMEQHNFHTTIAFVPWNYDRSAPTVVSLFRLHPERFSICIHGDNHAHREFGDYTHDPLSQQVADIKQSVARMERFHSLTGIDYDRFMVFPHGVAPQATFAALKTYGFLGTANSLNIPLDQPFPSDPFFLLRPYTASYAGLLSLSRYSVAVPVSTIDLAIQCFLQNPLLFYAHQDLFQDSVHAFSPIADTVNQMQPDTQWAGLGEIAKHLYHIRKRADGDYDVRTLSSEIAITNHDPDPRFFYVELDQSTIPPDAGILVDGVPAAPRQAENAASIRLEIPPHRTRTLQITSPNDLDLSRQPIGKTSLYAYLLRQISDFRDIHLSTRAWGRGLIGSYYANDGGAIELYFERKRLVPAAIAGVALAVLCCEILRRRRRQAVTDRTI